METQRVSGALGEGPVPRTVSPQLRFRASASPGRASTMASTEYAQYDSQSVKCVMSVLQSYGCTFYLRHGRVYIRTLSTCVTD